jgi:hypothetical protein
MVASLLLMQVSFAGAEDPQSSSSTLITPFEFHSAFWINLHHFLYQQALQKANRSRGSAPVERQTLSVAEQATWDQAVAFYQKTMVSHDLLFDSAMRGVETILADAENVKSLSSAPLDGDLRTQLEAAATVYRDHWWRLHNQANQFWISAVNGLYARVGWNRYESALQLFWAPQLNGTLSLQTAVSKTISALAVAENHDH